MATDYFLEILEPAVAGESKDKQYAGKIDISSFSWGASNPVQHGVGSGMSAGKVSFGSVNIMKLVDAATPALLLDCASGSHHKQVKLHVRKAAGSTGKQSEFYTIILDEVFIESIQHSGSGEGGSPTPMESISMAFGKFVIEYSPQKPDGTLDKAKNAGWNIKTNTKA